MKLQKPAHPWGSKPWLNLISTDQGPILALSLPLHRVTKGEALGTIFQPFERPTANDLTASPRATFLPESLKATGRDEMAPASRFFKWAPQGDREMAST